MRPSAEKLAAKAAGEKFYFTGRPCANGHIASRYVASGACTACQPLYHQRYVADDAVRERRNTKAAAWKRANPEKRNAASLEWARRNPEKVKASHRVQYEKNRERIREVQREYRAKNREKLNQLLKDWMARNPERAKIIARASKANRRARELMNGGRSSADDIARLYRLQKGRCVGPGCGKRLQADFHVDHIIPVIRDGSSDPSNLQLLCPSCNRRKGGKDPIEWARVNNRLL